jgi:alcohol dehydrogenase
MEAHCDSTYQRLPMRKFVSPEIIFGAGALELVGQYARNLSGRKVLLVSDPGVRGAGWVMKVEDSLRSVGLDNVCFDEVSVNPRSDDVMLGAEMYEKEACDLIVTVGGGSPIDCAKVIGLVASNKCDPLEFEGVDRGPLPGPPIINDDGTRRKFAIISKSLVPDVSLIDSVTTTTLTKMLTASTGMDALSHAFEAYVSNASSPITDMHALEAVRMIATNLLKACEEPANMCHRDRMMLASLYAGLAFSNASLGLVHAMSHSLGGYYDAAHGDCNAVILEKVIEFNYPAVPERYRTLEEAFSGKSGATGARGLADKVRDLRTRLGIDWELEYLGLRREDIPTLSRIALNDPSLATNPRIATLQDIERLYERAL